MLRPNVYVRHEGYLEGPVLPHEMSYPTGQTLQYGVTLAQESAVVRPHVPTKLSIAMRLFHCTGMLRIALVWHCRTAGKGRLLAIDTDRPQHRMTPRAARKGGRFVFRSRPLLRWRQGARQLSASNRQ